MDRVAAIIERVKETQPLVHNITNQVVMNFTANGLYALGAAPVMAHDRREVAEMAQNADALVLNIGTLTEELVEAMLIAGQAANEKGIPVVLDPVGVGATTFRTESTKRILEQVDIAIIRGNAGEVSQLAGIDAEVRGVDSSGEIDLKAVAKTALENLKQSVLITGKEDIIAADHQYVLINNGTSLLTKVTGTGCLLSAVVAAFLAVESSTIDAATAAIAYYTIAAEQAAKQAKLPGQFQYRFLDALSYTTSQDVIERLNITSKGEFK